MLEFVGGERRHQDKIEAEQQCIPVIQLLRPARRDTQNFCVVSTRNEAETEARRRKVFFFLLFFPFPRLLLFPPTAAAVISHLALSHYCSIVKEHTSHVLQFSTGLWSDQSQKFSTVKETQSSQYIFVCRCEIECEEFSHPNRSAASVKCKLSNTSNSSNWIEQSK